MCSWGFSSWPLDRIAYYRDYLAGMRRAIRERADLSVWASQAVLLALLQQDRGVSAIRCANQLSMFGVMEAAFEHGMDPTRDGLRIVGFSGMPFRLELREQAAVGI